MIKMGIKYKETILSDLIFQFYPGNSSVAYSIPSQTWFIGSFVQPEHAIGYLLESCFTIKNTHMLSGSLSIIAADTNVIKIGEHSYKIIHLLGKSFLNVKNIHLMKFQQSSYFLFSEWPCIFTIRRGIHPYIICYNIKRSILF